jgi:DNA-binding protein
MTKKEEDIELGNRIKTIRLSLELDQKQFAKKINATVSALSNWENGRNKPNMEKLSNISKLGNISLDNLLNGTIEEKKEYASSYLKKRIKELSTEDELSSFLIDNNDELLSILNILDEIDISTSSKEDIEELVEMLLSQSVYSTPKNTEEMIGVTRLVLLKHLSQIQSILEGKFNLIHSGEIDVQVTKNVQEILQKAYSELEHLELSYRKK